MVRGTGLRTRYSTDEAAISTPSKTSDPAASSEAGLDYRQAGVDIDAGNALVKQIAPLAKSTSRPGADAALGGFGGLFDLKAAGFSDPVLIAANDGVGTKLLVAIAAGQHDTVGIDLVAMCVNDLVVQGGEPLFFLDYYATGKLDVAVARDVVAGIAEGCKQAGCALIGGETAEMPGVYAGEDYDLAGFAVGAAERGTLLDGSQVAEGDVVLGLASSGVHSNGYSLVRKIVERTGLSYANKAPFDASQSLGAALLTPTRIYVKSCLAAVRKGYVHALAHITGGGFVENIPRVLPDHLAVQLDLSALEAPPVFGWLAQEGGIARTEMVRTFNCGVGMIVVCPAATASEAKALLENQGETVIDMGRVVRRTDEAVVIDGLDGPWLG